MRSSLVAARWRATPSVDRGYRARQHSTASAEVLVRRQWRWWWCGVPPAVRERCPMRIMLLLFKKKKIKRGSAAIKQDSDACWRVCRGCVAHDRPLAMSRERSAITETPQVFTSRVNNFPCAGKRLFRDFAATFNFTDLFYPGRYTLDIPPPAANKKLLNRLT